MSERFRRFRRAGLVAVMATTLVGATACGVVLYPERKGQTGGRIDPAVAVLDGIGLLFLLVPGVIAYGVDFSTGAIYLPGTANNGTLDMDDAEVVQTGDTHLDAHQIERIIREHTGQRISLADPALRARRAGANDWQPLAALLSERQFAALAVPDMQAAR